MFMAFPWRRLLGTVLFCLLAGSTLVALQPQAQSLNDGVYTAEQATRGQAIYRARCASCHGNNLEGRTGPPLAGNDFLTNWDTQPVLELANKIRKTMPRNESEKLTPPETADLLAHMFQVGKFPVGRAELASDDAALKRVNFPVRTASQPQAAPAVGQLPSLPPAGNVGQVMRGILFPSANIIFTVQSIDPGAKKPVVDTGKEGFDWFTWGQGVYSGWDVVDYAAVSVAESAKLMLTPGRRCENGKPVPLSDPDWIKFTLELEAAGKASYKASQSRNQEAVSESTNQLNDSCQNCHRVYRGRNHCVKP
jgi:S-disulfanyl-L-cysteine oxidoreductase SoxD